MSSFAGNAQGCFIRFFHAEDAHYIRQKKFVKYPGQDRRL